jgi:hypothetical protein
VSIRALQARSLPITRLAAPALLVATGLAIGTAQGPSPSLAGRVADQAPIGPAAALQPFAAIPRSIPLDLTVVASPREAAHKALPPVASAPITSLPAHLNTKASSIPPRALASYVNAATLVHQSDPQCRLKWQVLAGIGFIESDHARSGGSQNPHWNGVANPPIRGPVVHGGVRALGPMQFLPSTWAVYAADGNHDGVENPQDIDDETLAAGDYLCATGSDLAAPKHLIRAVYAYNHSYRYVRAVLTVTAHYMDINPAKLGINGLPKHRRRMVTMTIVAPAPPVGPAHSTTTAPSPSPSPTPVPTPSSYPIPTPSRSASPSPTPTPSPSPHLPHH